MKKIILVLLASIPLSLCAHGNKSLESRFNPKLTIPAQFLPRLTSITMVDIYAQVSDLNAWNALSFQHGTAILISPNLWVVTAIVAFDQLDSICNQSFVIAVSVTGTGDTLSV
jgi:hypothetical protein